MGLFSYFSARTSQKALTATPAVLETMAARQFSPYVALGGTNINAQRVGNAYVKVQNGSYSWLYLYSPPVRRVVDYIARNISQLGLKCYERVSDDEREHRGDHAAAEALRRPNPQTPGNYFIQEFVKCHLVYGNAYALKFRPSPGAPLVLVTLNPARVGIVGQSHFQADAYRIYSADGTFFDVPPEDMLRWPSTSVDDPRHGESPLETLRESIAADVAAQAAVTGLHRSGLVFSGWIERDIEAPEWSEEARKRFQESWTNQGRDSQKHTPVLEEGMKFKQAGVTPEDAQFIESRKFTLDYVASLYGMKDVPPESEEARRQFYADVLPPFCEGAAAFLDLHILQQEYAEDDYYFEFSLDEKLITDDRLKTLVSAAGAPIMLRNEARARLNLPAVEGGDELITPLNVVVGDNPRPSPQVMPIQDPNKPPQDGSHRTDDEPKSILAFGAEVEVIPNGNGHHKAHLIPRRVQIDNRRDRWAKEYEETLSKHFARQRRSVQAKSLTKASAVEALAEERWDKELTLDLDKVSRRHFGAEGNQAAFRINRTFDAGQGVNWLAAKAKGSAEAINTTTRQHIEEQGVTDAFALAAGARAAAAGKGYATDISAFSRKVAIEQDPNGDKRLVTITGGECDVCAEFQGVWPADDVPGWPGYHPGCNCIVDIDGGGKAVEPVKSEALELLTKRLEKHDEDFQQMMGLFKAMVERPVPASNVHVQPAETHFHKGAMESYTTVEAPPPAEVTLAAGAIEVPVNVLPAEVTFAKGAIPVTVEAPPPAELHFEEGAMKNEIVVEASKPADVNFHEGAFKVEGTEVNVPAPNVNVEAPKNGKKTVTFSDGSKAEIEESEEDERQGEETDA